SSSTGGSDKCGGVCRGYFSRPDTLFGNGLVASGGLPLFRSSIEKNVRPFSTCNSPCLSLYQHVVSPSPVRPSLVFFAHIILYMPALAASSGITFKCTV